MNRREVKVPALQGLSTSDRELMLTMMAALGSAAAALMKASKTLDDEDGLVYYDHVRELDAEANSIIDICKKAKDRLKPGGVLLVN